MFAFNSFNPLFHPSTTNLTSSSGDAQLKSSFSPSQSKPNVSAQQNMSLHSANNKQNSMDALTMQMMQKANPTSQLTLQQQTQLLANSMTPRMGNSLASAVFLRSIAANPTTPEASRFFPFFMTSGSPSNHFPDYPASLGMLNPYALMQEEPKPNHSYIGLIAMAILSSADKKLVLSDIYQYILDNYPYFRTRGPGWRNSIRHNLSLNDCFVKAGRSANGKGHFWAIHPACRDDFAKGDFRRRHAQRKVRRAMGLAVPDEESDGNRSPSPVAAHQPLSPFKLHGNSSVSNESPKLLSPLKCGTVTVKGVKREHDDCNEDNINHVSDMSPVKSLVIDEEVKQLTPPMKKRQKRCFSIESLLSPDSDDDLRKTGDDEHVVDCS